MADDTTAPPSPVGGQADDLAPIPARKPGSGKRSILFFVVVGAVLVTFFVLGRQGRPPNMPGNDVHKLRFNLKGELIGLEGEEGLESALAPGFQLDKKAIEKRVNTRCTSCHGDTTVDRATHACAALGTCLPEHHPPKGECIKCHRMPPPPVPTTP